MFLLAFWDTLTLLELFDVELTVAFFCTATVVFLETFWVLLAVELEVWLTATVTFFNRFYGSYAVELLALT